MPRIVWLTDLHLNFCSPDTIDLFLARVLDARPDAVLISGDVSESRQVIDCLRLVARRLARPIYFVLGNHDYYHGSILDVREQVAEFCAGHPHCVYLTQSGVVRLTESVGLVGHDGWADGRIGDYENSFVMLNDYKLIAELAGYSKAERLAVLQAMGDQAAQHVRHVLSDALAQFRSVWLVTHVPPLREACWHDGRLSDDEWAPHFTCKAVGDTLLELMRQHPRQQLTVLCGHTHSAGFAQPLPNVEIFTGGAAYRQPEIQRIFELE